MGKNSSVIYQLSDSEFISLFKSCHSYSEVLRSLGLCTSGSASRTVLFARMEILSLTHDDLSKEKPPRTAYNALSDIDIFKENSHISGHALKDHYLKLRTDPYQCDVCGISEWNGKHIVLHLDHINGIKTDNRFHNLRLLCPNCDSQMPTYRGKNIKVKGKYSKYIQSSKHIQSSKRICPICNKNVSAAATYCRKCSNKINAIKIRRFVIDRDTLKMLIRTTPFTTIAENYGVSDNAIRKRCKCFGLPYRVVDIKKYSDAEWSIL